MLASGDSSVNTSFASATLDSESEYESASETAGSGIKVSRDIIEDLVQKSKERWMPVYANTEDSRSEDSHFHFGEEMKPEVAASRQQFTRHRSQENSVGSDENLSPVSRINGSFSTGCLSPAVLPYYPKRALPSQLQAAPSPGLSKQLLGIGFSNHQPPELQSPGLSDLFQRKVALRDEEKTSQALTPFLSQNVVGNVASVSSIIAIKSSSAPSLGTNKRMKSILKAVDAKETPHSDAKKKKKVMKLKPFKDPLAPKKPKSAFMLFCDDLRPTIKEELGNIPVPEMGKELGR